MKARVKYHDLVKNILDMRGYTILKEISPK